MSRYATRAAASFVILTSNTVVLAFAFFLIYVSSPHSLIYVILALILGFASGLYLTDLRLSFIGSMLSLVLSLVADAVLAGALTYLYSLPGAIRRVMALLFLQKTLLPALIVVFPVYMILWALGSLLHDSLVQPNGPK